MPINTKFLILARSDCCISLTGHEIWDTLESKIDGFVAGAGTGGTLAGVSHVLKRNKQDVVIALVDPPGSSLYNKVYTRYCARIFYKLEVV